MKQVFVSKCLCVGLIVGCAILPSSTRAAQLPFNLAQAQSNYNQDMQLGYDATKDRNYPAALKYFKQALEKRPEDKYAITAVSNVESYIARDRRQGNKRKRYVTYIPGNIGAPVRRVPGVTRGPIASEQACIPSGKQQLTALVPEIDRQRTTAAYPSFFFYIPQTSAPALELVLLDDQDDVVYKGTFPAPAKPGIVGFNLPDNSTVPGLKMGKTYQWFFSVICDRKDRSSDLQVRGLIQRIAPNQKLTTELTNAPIPERPAIYAMSGLWQDALATLAQLRREHPTDATLKTDWEDLLSSVGLEGIAQEPLIISQ